MSLKYLDIHPHIEKALALCGLALAVSSTRPGLVGWQVYTAATTVWLLWILAIFQLILYIGTLVTKSQ